MATATIHTLWRRAATAVSLALPSTSSQRALTSSAALFPSSASCLTSGRRPIISTWTALAPTTSSSSSSSSSSSLIPSSSSPSWFRGVLSGVLARFSSTLKKRRSKMNKHKLKKRRKLLRNKNAKNL
ncbi:hypothetical protein VYU27_007251 [Nannochloropsis oceanica]